MTTFSLAGHSVQRVGFGAMQLPGPGVFGPPRDHDEAIAVLRRAVELGVNHIDTSQFYGPNVSNELIKEALHPYDDDLVIVSKVGGKRDEQGNWLPDQHPDALRAGVLENLETLGVESLPVVNLRVMPQEEMSDPGVEFCPFDEQLEAMKQLVADGLIESFGVSSVTVEQAEQGIEAGAVCVQNAYSVLARQDEPTLALCRERGVAYVPFFPLGSAFPGMPKVTEDETVKRIASERGATPSQVGLAWLLAHAENVLLIPGTSSRAHLEQNCAVADVTLTPEDVAALDALA